jgi:hypothetical protein
VSAFKVGDRVKVEFDGVVVHVGQHGAIAVEPDGHPSRAVLNGDLATKFAPTEPVWADGDAIRVVAVTATYTLVFDGDRWLSHTGGLWHPAAVSSFWRDGDVTRLVPAVKS